MPAVIDRQPVSKGSEEAVPFKNWVAVLGGALGAFMAVLDIQIVNSSLPDIQGALGASLDEGTWIATAYLVAEIVTIPLTVWLSKVFGLRNYVLGNAVLFIIFSVACAFATDLPQMIMFRAAQGFTGGTLIPMAFTIILMSLPLTKRPVGMAIFGVTATFAPSVGPAIGGWLTWNFGWQYIFYLNIIPGIIFLIMLAYALPKEKPQLELFKQGDWIGIATMAAGLSCMEVVLEEGNRNDWFGSPTILTLFIVAVVCLSIFIVNEFLCKNPLLNLRLLGNRNFGLGNLTNVALGMGMYSSIYLLPVYLAQMQGYNAQQVGDVLIWMGLPQLLIIPFIPRLMKVIDARLMVVTGLVLFCGSALMNAFMTPLNGGPQIIPSLLVRALGQPLIMVPLSSLTTGSIEQEQAGSASALFNMMRNMGGSVGIALMSTLLTIRMQFHYSRLGESISVFQSGFLEQQKQLSAYFMQQGHSLVDAKQQALNMLANQLQSQAYTMAFNDAFLIMSGVILLSVIPVALMKKLQKTDGAASAAH